ncbi:MAG: LysE family translocator [Candidatus Thermoplasmatota archaeon]|nr:LysE family translocator [Candidatus Thermoplasmatota archaeon]
MDTTLLYLALLFIIPMCFTPGPNNVLCAAHGSRFGFRSTLPLIGGMAIGWSTLGLVIGAGTDIIARNEEIFEALGILGAAYIAYLGYKIATSPLAKDANLSEALGVRTGIFLQIVNGKAWIHFLVLMTTFGTVFGESYSAKVALVAMNLIFGLPAVMAWAAFGSYLRKIFSSDRAGRTLNALLGTALVAVALWIVLSS